MTAGQFQCQGWLHSCFIQHAEVQLGALVQLQIVSPILVSELGSCSHGRHYVNNVVQYITGVESITSAVTRHVFRQRKPKLQLGDRLFQLTHYATDVGNWVRVRAAGQATLAAIAAMAGRRTITRLRSPALPSALVPTNPRFPRRPVYGAATAAAATYAATLTEAGPLQQVLGWGAKLGDACKGLGMSMVVLTETAGRQASTTTSSSVTNTVSAFSNAGAATIALCGAATKGAAGLMNRPGYGTSQSAAPSRRVSVFPRLHRRHGLADQQALVVSSCQR